ncbi:MAG: 50S ribosomal protein L10 [Chloroflexi bacterium]|nr:50S ribosomal protein L10 [Chloroflexota bacterium]MBU1749038.1 50S ribosomal protein L10 [Chloroflexota bacterium]MBU1878241.1 50S ribosomal protein L10 [Chloroflexota bacterium]
MPTEEKKHIVGTLVDKLERSHAAVLTAYQSENLSEGLDMEQLTTLRRQLQDVDGDYHVVKNTLFKLALSQAKYPLSDATPALTGPTAVAFCYDDVVEPFKRLVEFARATPLFAIKGGFHEGRFLTPNDVVSISSLPPREVLLAQVVGGIQAPISGLVSVLAGTMRGLVNVLEARRKQMEEEGAGA